MNEIRITDTDVKSCLNKHKITKENNIAYMSVFTVLNSDPNQGKCLGSPTIPFYDVYNPWEPANRLLLRLDYTITQESSLIVTVRFSKGINLWFQQFELYQSNRITVIQSNIEVTYDHSKNNVTIRDIGSSPYNNPFFVFHNHFYNTVVLYFAVKIPKQTISRVLTASFDSHVIRQDLNDYRKLVNNNDLSDLVFLVGDDKFFAHKAILAARSPVFYEMLVENQKLSEIEIQHIDPKVMMILLEFIYTSNLNDDAKDVNTAIQVLPASCKYSINGLSKKLEQIVISGLSLKNVISAILLANTHSELKGLKDKCIDFVVKSGKLISIKELETLGNWAIYAEIIAAMSEEISKLNLQK